MQQFKKVKPTPRSKAGTFVEAVPVKRFKPGEDRSLALLGLKSSNLLTLQKDIEQGFPVTVLRHIQHHYAFSRMELADALRVSARTLDRREALGRLDPLESDRALRLSRVYAKAVELYEGNEKAALAWLKRKNRALGNVPPVDLIKTEIGALQVEHLIGRLEYGVYS